MRGLMGERPLLVTSCLQHAANYHADIEIVSRSVEGPIHRYTYAEAERGARKLAKALLRLGIAPGDRVGTLAWNTWRHFELYYGISGIGAVCHTINPRLYDDQIVYIVNHAQDRILFVDTSFVPLVERLRPHLPEDCQIVLLGNAETSLAANGSYDELTAAENDDFAWPEFDERSASALCYTSGTTGKPKGVLYSHRSTMLHTYAGNSAETFGIRSVDRILPAASMYHACAWGLPYCATMVGATLVLPGRHLDGASLYRMLESERVTMTAGVPTIWLGLLAHLRTSGERLTS